MLCAEPIRCSTAYGRVWIDGLSLNEAWWCAYDHSQLWAVTGWRGESRLVEGEPGRRPRPGVADEREVDLPIMVTGALDWTGQTYDDPVEGMLRNVEHLRGRLLRSGQVTLPLHWQVGGLWTQIACQPRELDVDLLPQVVIEARLTVALPSREEPVWVPVPDTVLVDGEGRWLVDPADGAVLTAG